MSRFEPPFRRYGGIIVDVIYDHFLARDWDAYCDTALERFAADVQDAVECTWEEIPEIARARLLGMCTERWLCSYRDLAGISAVLSRISQRLKRPFDLSSAVAFLERDHDAFHSDFEAFMPHVIAQVVKRPHVRGG